MRAVAVRFALLLSLALGAASAPAQETAPDVLLAAVAREVITVLRQERNLHPGSQSKVAETVEARVLPLFDFAHMTRSAVARNWRLASPEQQSTLTKEFRTLLVRTYTSVLSSYSDQVIEFKPLRAAAGVSEVTVKSEMKQSGREPMAIDYDMQKTGAGWRVDDIKIAGVSLVTTYRADFADEVRNGGVAGLIKSLSDKNKSAENKPHANLRELSLRVYAFIHEALQHAK